MEKMETYIDGETWGKEVMKEPSAIEKFLSAVDTLGMKACSESVGVWQRRCSQLQTDMVLFLPFVSSPSIRIILLIIRVTYLVSIARIHAEGIIKKRWIT